MNIDFTECRWGHNVTVIAAGRCAGWSTPRPSNGDTVTWLTRTGVAKFTLSNVTHYADPPDMWAADFVRLRCPV